MFTVFAGIKITDFSKSVDLGLVSQGSKLVHPADNSAFSIMMSGRSFTYEVVFISQIMLIFYSFAVSSCL